MTKLIGITGGIGSGKSVVSRICRLKGYLVYDCDLEAKRLMHEDEQLKLSLREKCGDAVIAENGLIDRQCLAWFTFSDDEFRQWLNSEVHSMVRDDIDLWYTRCRERRLEVCFVESAILKTSALDEKCDSIWLVTCPEDERIRRVIGRGSIAEEDLKRRMVAQKSEFESLPGDKTVTINNDGSLSLLKQIDRLLN